jgi:hypothetical protein
MRPTKRKSGSAEKPPLRDLSAATLTPKGYPKRRPSVNAIQRARDMFAPLEDYPQDRGEAARIIIAQPGLPLHVVEAAMNAISFTFIADAKTSVTAYNVDISEVIGPTGSIQSRGRFRARCRETATEIVSINGEHDICHAMTLAGWPNGPVRFWRGTTPSLSHSSIHAMGKYRIALGDKCPQRMKRETSPEISTETRRGSPRNRETLGARP